MHKVPEFEEHARLWTPLVERLDEMSASHGFRAYADYHAILEKKDVDNACVLVPVSLRREITPACAEPWFS